MPHRWHKPRSMSTELWCGTGPMPWTGRCTMRRFWRFPTQRSRVSCSNGRSHSCGDSTPLAVCPVREHPQQRIEESVGPARSVAWHGPRLVHASRTGIEPTRPADSDDAWRGRPGELRAEPWSAVADEVKVQRNGLYRAAGTSSCMRAPTTAPPIGRWSGTWRPWRRFSIPDAGSCGPGRQPRGSP